MNCCLVDSVNNRCMCDLYYFHPAALTCAGSEWINKFAADNYQ